MATFEECPPNGKPEGPPFEKVNSWHLLCPKCGERYSWVRTTRSFADCIRRRRQCRLCYALYWTEERIVEVPADVKWGAL